MRQSIGVDNREQTLRDIDSLALEKYIEEIVSSIAEGAGKCKTEKDVWSAVEVSCRLSGSV
jgi:regulator of nonsense transcripts 2